MKKLIGIITFALSILQTQAQSTRIYYRCMAYDDTNSYKGEKVIDVKIEAKANKEQEVSLHYLKKGTVDNLKKDDTYRPRTHKNYYRFYGLSTSSGYRQSLIIHKGLFKGKRIGNFKIRARGEGYFSYPYSCVITETSSF